MAFRHLRIGVLLGALFLVIIGCADPIVPPVAVAVQGVRVKPQTLVFFGTGETKSLSATIDPANASDQSVIWESTDPSIASVDEFGKVTARAVGYDVFITAYTHDGNFQASCNVQVNPQ